MGKHYNTIPEADQGIRGELDFLLTLLALVGVCLLKISIALSLLALIPTSGVWMSRVIWALVGVCRPPLASYMMRCLFYLWSLGGMILTTEWLLFQCL